MFSSHDEMVKQRSCFCRFCLLFIPKVPFSHPSGPESDQFHPATSKRPGCPHRRKYTTSEPARSLLPGRGLNKLDLIMTRTAGLAGQLLSQSPPGVTDRASRRHASLESRSIKCLCGALSSFAHAGSDQRVVLKFARSLKLAPGLYQQTPGQDEWKQTAVIFGSRASTPYRERRTPAISLTPYVCLLPRSVYAADAGAARMQCRTSPPELFPDRQAPLRSARQAWQNLDPRT